MEMLFTQRVLLRLPMPTPPCIAKPFRIGSVIAMFRLARCVAIRKIVCKSLLAISLVLFAAMSNSLHTQPISRYNVFSYNVNEGLLQSTIGNMAVDKNNYCWISFPNGIQKFDGKNFITVPVQPGLPDDKLCLLFNTANGDVFVSHSAGISHYSPATNTFRQVYTHKGGEQLPALIIGEDEGVFYFYTQGGVITGIHGKSFALVSEAQAGLTTGVAGTDAFPTVSTNVLQHKTALVTDSVICLWDLKKGKPVAKNAFPVKRYGSLFLRLKSEGQLWYSSYEAGRALNVYDFKTGVSTVADIAKNKTAYRVALYPWQNTVLVSYNGRLFQADTGLQRFTCEMMNFQNKPAAGNGEVSHIKEDNLGNLYLQTIRTGIRKIIRNNYPLKFFSTGKPEENFILSVLPDKKRNRVLAGTFLYGLLVFDTLQRLVKRIEQLPGHVKGFSPNTILKGKDGYYLFCSGEKRIWKLSDDLSRITPMPYSSLLPPDQTGIGYFGLPLFQNEREAIVQTQQNLYRLDFLNNTVSEHRVGAGYFMGGMIDGNSLITHANDQLIFLNAADFTKRKRISFPNTGYVRCFAKDKAGKIYIGTNKGIFKIDGTGKILQQHTRQNGLPDECIYAMAFDQSGGLWCSSNKGLFRLNNANSVLQLKKEDGLQENEFNTNVMAVAEDGEMFFGGVNGISSFYPQAINRYVDKPRVLLTGLKINNQEYNGDSGVWQLQKLALPYNQNSFSFDFTAMGASNPDQYIYQYRMKGLENEWVQNNGAQTVRYFLQPGTYRFQLMASRQFDAAAKPQKEILLIINPPFWKSWWFMAAVVALLFGLLTLFVNQQYRRSYEKRLQQLEAERQLKQERERISKDLHDSIGAYANAVLYDVELLEQEKEEERKAALIGELKFASKDIITSLRETVWALKKESYSAEDCLLRIRNFVQPLSRHYNHIHFKVEGEAPVTTLHYTKALNLVRSVQEAVTNSIKHANAKNISVCAAVEAQAWRITVGDDGEGFDAAGAMRKSDGNGLHNMHDRATASGFMLTIASVIKEGTIVTIVV